MSTTSTRINHSRYFTSDNVDVTRRIETGRTFLFLYERQQSHGDAYKKARQIKSYVYEVYAYDTDGKRVAIGFGVPR